MLSLRSALEEKDGAAVLDLTVHAVEQIGSPAEGTLPRAAALDCFCRQQTADLPPIQRLAGGGDFTLEASVHSGRLRRPGDAVPTAGDCRCPPTGDAVPTAGAKGT